MSSPWKNWKLMLTRSSEPIIPEGIYSSGRCWDGGKVDSCDLPTGRCSSSWPLRCRPGGRTVPGLSATVSPVCGTWLVDSGTKPAHGKHHSLVLGIFQWTCC